MTGLPFIPLSSILIHLLSSCRLTVQNIQQAGTVPVQMETPAGKTVTVREGDDAELACVGVGLPIPRYS